MMIHKQKLEALLPGPIYPHQMHRYVKKIRENAYFVILFTNCFISHQKKIRENVYYVILTNYFMSHQKNWRQLVSFIIIGVKKLAQ